MLVGGIQYCGIVVNHGIKIPEAGFGKIEIQRKHRATEYVFGFAPAGIDIATDEAADILYFVLTGFVGFEVFGEGFWSTVRLRETTDKLRPGCFRVLPLELFAGTACGDFERAVVEDDREVYGLGHGLGS